MDNELKPRRGWYGPLILAALLIFCTMLSTVGMAGATGEFQAGQTPSPTAGGQLQLPTATPTLLGGPTATASRTPTLVPVLAEIIGDPTNLRTGPGIDFEVIAELTPGATLPIIGRWLGYDWLLVAWEDAPEGKAWVYQPLVIVRGDITTVPAVEPPAPPTVDPTRAAIEATATILLQTPGAAETATATAFFAPTGVYTQTPPPGGAVAGLLPTFTPAPPYVQPEALPVPEGSQPVQRGIPPAVMIIALGAMGALMLVLGVLRRLF